MRIVLDLTTEYEGMREAARRLGCGENTVHNLIRRGRLSVIRTPIGTLVCVQDVIREAARRAVLTETTAPG